MCTPAVQDLAIHRSEIHGKLVAIMRERLAHALEGLPAAAAAWAAAPELRGLPAPSALAAASAKQLRILGQVSYLGRCRGCRLQAICAALARSGDRQQ